MKRHALLFRSLTAMAGLVLLILALLFPLVTRDNVENGDGGREKMDSLFSGDVMEQPLRQLSAFSEISLRVDGNRSSKELTLSVSLLQNGRSVASEDFPLEKVRAGGRLRMLLPATLPGGDYILRVEAIGTGDVKLGGQSATPCTINGESAAMGCLVRTVAERRVYGTTMLYCGGLLMLLACVPSGGGQEKRRVRPAVPAHACGWLLPCGLAVAAVISVVLSTQSAAFGLGEYNLHVEDEFPVLVTLGGVTVHLPLMWFCLCASWGVALLLWELTRRELQLHRIAFLLTLFGGLMMALCKPTLYLYGWDEGAHREIMNCIAGTTPYSLPELTTFATTWWFGYIPNVLGLLIGSLLGLGEAGMLRLGFMSAAVVYALLSASAVRRAPKYKLTFLTIAALPTCLVIASDFTYDAMTIAGLLLGTALVLEAVASPTALLSGQTALRMMLSLTLCTIAKPAYSLALLLLLMLPKSKFGSARRHTIFVIFTLVVLAACLATCLLGSYADMIGGDSRMDGTDSAAQLRYVLAHPGAFLLMLGRYALHTMTVFFADASACWGQNHANALFSRIFLGLLFLLAPFYASQEPPLRLTARRRFAMGGIALFPLLVLMVTQYMVSTAVGSDSILGMQPRYVLPILPPLCVALMMPERWRTALPCGGRWVASVMCLCLMGYFFGDGWQEVMVLFYSM